jgi:hypothetical protein
MDKVITVVVLLFLSSYSLFVFLDFSLALIIFLVMIILILLGLFMLLSKFSRNLINRLLERYIKNYFSGFSKTFFFLTKKRKSMLLYNLIVTSIKFVVFALIHQLIFVSYGQRIGFLFILSISAASLLLSLIPISISGLGVKESFSILAYSQLGVPPSLIFSIYLVLNVISYSLAGVFIVLLNGGSSKN